MNLDFHIAECDAGRHFGAESCAGNFESYLAAIAVMDRVLRYEGEHDAVIQAGFGEHGSEGL